MTKENIIIAALRLFLMRGYKSVSLIDVANELGITKGGIYHYFSSKDDLLQTALHSFLDRFEAKYTQLLSGKDTLQEILNVLIVENAFEQYSKDLLGVDRECNIDHVHFAIEIMLRFPDVQERIQQGHVTLCEALAQKIQTAMEQGELKPALDSYALATAILAMINGQRSLGNRFQSVEIRKRMMDSVWNLINN